MYELFTDSFGVQFQKNYDGTLNLLKAPQDIEGYQIQDSVTSIGPYAFSDCKKLTKIVIPDSVSWLGEGCFSGCISLSEMTLPDSLRTIPSRMIKDCVSLGGIRLPRRLKCIGDEAFANCSYLFHVKIPRGVEDIGYHAFFGCTGLNDLLYPIDQYDHYMKMLLKDENELAFLKKVMIPYEHVQGS
jgi:hypothetical protein